tara:strand:- start:7248 stop:7661 length:414 start_codon:yes stop_codon:yes gene_type:complete
MNKEEELKEKINQLSARDRAAVALTFADSVAKFLKNQSSIDALSVAKLVLEGEEVSASDLSIAYADATANAAATAATATASAAAAYAAATATDSLAAAFAAYAVADAATDAAKFARIADPSITIESQIKIVDDLLIN